MHGYRHDRHWLSNPAPKVSKGQSQTHSLTQVCEVEINKPTLNSTDAWCPELVFFFSLLASVSSRGCLPSPLSLSLFPSRPEFRRHRCTIRPTVGAACKRQAGGGRWERDGQSRGEMTPALGDTNHGLSLRWFPQPRCRFCAAHIFVYFVDGISMKYWASDGREIILMGVELRPAANRK